MKLGKNILIVYFVIFAAGSLFYGKTCQADELIAYSRLTDGFWQIWVAKPDGSDARQLTDDELDKTSPNWVTGKSLIYRTNQGRLFEIGLENKEAKPILEKFDNIAGFDISKDAKIVFARFRTDLIDDCDIWTAGLDGSDGRMITNNAGLQYDPCWAPGDSKKIVFASKDDPTMHAIWTIDTNIGEKARIAYNDYYNILPRFSQDAKRIVFAANKTGDYEIFVMDSDGKNQKQLTDSKGLDTSPSWSPDGSKIIFVSNRSGNLQIWKMDADGLNQEQVTHGENECIDPKWVEGE